MNLKLSLFIILSNSLTGWLSGHIFKCLWISFPLFPRSVKIYCSLKMYCKVDLVYSRVQKQLFCFVFWTVNDSIGVDYWTLSCWSFICLDNVSLFMEHTTLLVVSVSLWLGSTNPYWREKLSFAASEYHPSRMVNVITVCIYKPINWPLSYVSYDLSTQSHFQLRNPFSKAGLEVVSVWTFLLAGST